MALTLVWMGPWVAPSAWSQTSTGLALEVVLEPGASFADGYIIAAPRFNSNLTYPIILDETGAALHNELHPYEGFNFDLHPDGRMSWYHTLEGLWHILDSSLQTAQTMDFLDADPDYHDFELQENGHAMLLGQEIVLVNVADSAPDPSNPNRSLIDCLLQEQDPEGNVTWFWRASEHIPATWCTHCNWNSSLIDAYHHNAFQVLEDGDVLLCLRNMDAVVRIDRVSGSLDWVLGGPFSDFTFSAPYMEFKHPHDAQMSPSGTLLLFDNGTDKAVEITRGVEFVMDLEEMVVEQIAEWLHPDLSYASSQGSIQRLEDGGTLISWGTGGSDAYGGGMITEYTAGGNLRGAIYFPGNHYSYRARKVPPGALPLLQGCRNPQACNYDASAAIDGPCVLLGSPCDDGNACTVGDVIQGDCQCAGLLPPENAPVGCSDPVAANYDPCSNPTIDDGSCLYGVTFRVDVTMLDGMPGGVDLVMQDNALALEPAGFGTWKGTLLLGNGNWEFGFMADGTSDAITRSLELTWPVDGSIPEQRACFGLEATACPGCTDPDDLAYSPFSSDDERCGSGSWSGCTEPAADNFDPGAFFDDGSCTFGPADSCPMDLDEDGLVGVSDILQLLTYFGLVCD